MTDNADKGKNTGKGKITAAFAMAMACAWLCGCRTTASQLAHFEQCLVTGDYAGAAQLGGTLARKDNRNTLLWQLNAASACALDGRMDDAITYADAAEALAISNDFASAVEKGARTAGAVLVNDMATDYEASGPELVYNGLLKAIQYLALGNRNACRTELNRMMGWQEEYRYRRGKYINAMMETIRKEQRPDSLGMNRKVSEAMQNCPELTENLPESAFRPALETLAAADYLNAYALHVAGVFRHLNGDGGRVQLKRAMELAPSNPSVARDFADCDAGRKPSGQVWVWIENGLCPARAEFVAPVLIPIPMPYGGMEMLGATVAMPYLVPRGAAFAACQVNGVPCAPLQDFDRLVQSDFAIWMKGATAREVARVSTRIASQAALLIAEYNADDPDARLSMQLARLGVMAYSMGSSAADIRSAAAMPKSVEYCRVDRPANGRIQVVADGQAISVTLPENASNAMVFVRKMSPYAPAAVAVAGF